MRCSLASYAAGVGLTGCEAARLGERRSRQFYNGLLGLPYLAPLYIGLRHSSVALLPLLTLPSARKLAASFRDGKMVDLPKRTAKFQFAFCSLFVLSILLPSPSVASIAAKIARAIGAIGSRRATTAEVVSANARGTRFENPRACEWRGGSARHHATPSESNLVYADIILRIYQRLNAHTICSHQHPKNP